MWSLPTGRQDLISLGYNRNYNWIPAFAGMTEEENRKLKVKSDTSIQMHANDTNTEELKEES